MTDSPVNVAIIVGGQGRGSNMRALAEACLSGDVPAKVALVIGPKEPLPALEAARGLGLLTNVLSPTAEDYADQLLTALQESDTQYVCLAGYLRLLPEAILKAFPNRILNIHPALLPKFGGKGMYGMHVHQKVIENGETESGCTVHLVNEHYDEGRILLQMKCPVLPGDTPETLASRVLSLEHKAYATALSNLIRENLRASIEC